MRLKMRFLTALMCGAVLLSGSPALANDPDNNTVGTKIGAASLTVLYLPVKLVYAALGGVVGGLAWGLSGGDSAVMNAVITPAVRGDYAVMPAHLREGRFPEFLGRDPAYAAQSTPQYVEQAVVFEESY
jgi:hypothetical protein